MDKGNGQVGGASGLLDGVDDKMMFIELSLFLQQREDIWDEK